MEGDHQQDVSFSIERFKDYGQALHISLPSSFENAKGKHFQLKIEYETQTEGPALCWLTAEQTASKTKPYLFTQGQAALNRSFFPCQDTPAHKYSYSADITVCTFVSLRNCHKTKLIQIGRFPKGLSL